MCIYIYINVQGHACDHTHCNQIARRAPLLSPATRVRTRSWINRIDLSTGRSTSTMTEQWIKCLIVNHHKSRANRAKAESI